MPGLSAIPAGFPELAIVVVTAALTGGLLLYFFALKSVRTTHSTYDLIQQADRKPVFLFDDETLADATPSAREMLRAAPSAPSSWQRLIVLLSPRFSTLEDDIADIGARGEAFVAATRPGDTGLLHIEWWDGLVRLELGDAQQVKGDVRVDGQCLQANQDELDLLRHISEASPVLAWQLAGDGTLIWANAAYIAVANSLSAADRTGLWPPAKFLPELAEKAPDGMQHRLALRPEDCDLPGLGAKPRWFDCRKTSWKGTTICIALESGAEVNARATLDEFVQTLSKTFAHLSVGLAVFDRARQLVLFNPALTDLTGLDVLFLSQKPELVSFLDELRNKRMIPEPKNYANWREHIRRLEASACDGTYEETWSLPSGRTYKIMGRPHPNGAIAFQFEDITPEITLTRQFRAELELSQAVMDTLPEAMVVFSAAGTLTMSNRAYNMLWNTDPGRGVTEITCSDALSRWAAGTRATAVWAGVESSICRLHNREAWSADAQMEDGRHLFIEVTPIAGGATLVKFMTGQSSDKTEHIWKTRRLPEYSD